LADIAAGLLADVDEAATSKVGRDGLTVMERFENEAMHLRPLPPVPFDVRRVVPVTVSRQALVRFEGVEYSVPSEWARLDATAYIGVERIDVHGLGSRVTLSRARRGKRQVKYRHYLSELSRKPQALRQVAPELLDELEAPYRQLWDALADVHGQLEAARVLGKILAAANTCGEEKVARWLDQALRGRPFAAEVAPRSQPVEIPAALAAYTISAGRAADYDVLLERTSR